MLAGSFYIAGGLAGLVAFFAVPKTSRFVRFHSLQAFVFDLGWIPIVVALIVLGGLLIPPDFEYGIVLPLLASVPILGFAVLWGVVSVRSGLKAARGEAFRIPFACRVAERFA